MQQRCLADTALAVDEVMVSFHSTENILDQLLATIEGIRLGDSAAHLVRVDPAGNRIRSPALPALLGKGDARLDGHCLEQDRITHVEGSVFFAFGDDQPHTWRSTRLAASQPSG